MPQKSKPVFNHVLYLYQLNIGNSQYLHFPFDSQHFEELPIVSEIKFQNLDICFINILLCSNSFWVYVMQVIFWLSFCFLSHSSKYPFLDNLDLSCHDTNYNWFFSLYWSNLKIIIRTTFLWPAVYTTHTWVLFWQFVVSKHFVWKITKSLKMDDSWQSWCRLCATIPPPNTTGFPDFKKHHSEHSGLIQTCFKISVRIIEEQWALPLLIKLLLDGRVLTRFYSKDLPRLHWVSSQIKIVRRNL